ncbi:MAG: hypothetical protein H6572_03685 [Lewinellaceae bacterium]|nr:hypothetical protein [Lewinellaceae bacterium]
MQLQLFKYSIHSEEQQLNDIRTAKVEIDGEIWFVATDVASTLGYRNLVKLSTDSL